MPDPVGNLASALSAYNRVAGTGGAAIQAQEARDDDEFADLVKGAIRAAIAEGNESEAKSISAAGGTADLADVVTAVAEAELTLQTVIAVRDKVIEAYREILRMPM